MTTAITDDFAALARADAPPDEATVEALLRLDGEQLEELYTAADRVRAEYVGDEIYIRGIIEFSNICRLSCNYCGIRKGNRQVARYRMMPEKILELAQQAAEFGYSTVVLQSGEDPWFTCDRVCDIVRRIKDEAGIAVTLSLGERPAAEYRAFREAGCDRYLLRFETSDRELFKRLHPDDDFDRRIGCLAAIREADIQLGSGFMIGLPGRDLGVLARDILYCTGMDLDMIGCGPFVSHPDTPLADEPLFDDREIYLKTIAILRLLNPWAHIPATTAYDAIFPDGRNLLLQRGANVFMPNVTPQEYRGNYLLYPNKPCVDESGEQCRYCTVGRVLALGRKPGLGPGHSRRPDWLARHPEDKPADAAN